LVRSGPPFQPDQHAFAARLSELVLLDAHGAEAGHTMKL
jgi:hypothetical protein